MKYQFKAHPTVFEGVQYRSRLEATWAAFFTYMDWSFVYEPFDLQGWVPDFVLRGRSVSRPKWMKAKTFAALGGKKWGSREILVEVKPSWNHFDQSYKDTILCATDIDAKILLLTQFEDRPYDEYQCWDGFGGLLLERWQDEDGEQGQENDDAALAHCIVCKQTTIISASGGWGCRLCGAYDGDGLIHPCEYYTINPLDVWKQAKNATQWRGY